MVPPNPPIVGAERPGLYADSMPAAGSEICSAPRALPEIGVILSKVRERFDKFNRQTRMAPLDGGPSALQTIESKCLLSEPMTVPGCGLAAATLRGAFQ